MSDRLNRESTFPTEIVKELGKRGFLGMTISPDYGGMGVDNVAYSITVEEISRVCASTGVIVSVNNSLVCHPLNKYGNDEQKKKYLTPLASGVKLGSFGLTEPGAGTDVSSLQSTAVKEGDEYIINGSKTFITNGPNSDTFIVFAATDKEARHKGISAFIMDRESQGFDANSIAPKLGIHASSTADLAFDNVRVPTENLLGNLGDGFKISMNTLDGGRIGIASQALGIAQASLDHTLSFLDSDDGPTRLSKKQSIQHKVADMATEIEAARLLVYKAAFTKDTKDRYSEEAAMAKLHAANTAMKVSSWAFEIMGSRANLEKNMVERYLRDAKITEIYEGTSEVQRMVIAAARLR